MFEQGSSQACSAWTAKMKILININITKASSFANWRLVQFPLKNCRGILYSLVKAIFK